MPSAEELKVYLQYAPPDILSLGHQRVVRDYLAPLQERRPQLAIDHTWAVHSHHMIYLQLRAGTDHHVQTIVRDGQGGVCDIAVVLIRCELGSTSLDKSVLNRWEMGEYALTAAAPCNCSVLYTAPATAYITAPSMRAGTFISGMATAAELDDAELDDAMGTEDAEEVDIVRDRDGWRLVIRRVDGCR